MSVKGIILAGGTGSRLGSLVRATNKHLLPVGDEPMIYHPLKKLTDAGVRDIMIVTGTEHIGLVVQALGSGRDFACEFTYRVQDRAGGIAEALGLARNFSAGERIVVLLGDNIFQDDITPFIKKFDAQEKGARILLKEVEDPERFGVAEVKGERVVGIEEKPEQPKSKFAVTGIYMYDAAVFEIVKTLKPSGRGELEITDVNNAYIARKELAYDVLDGWWTDAGTLSSLAKANELVRGKT